MYQNEKTISEKEIYKGRVVHLTCDEVELENGYKTLREVIHHPGGVCIVALDEDENVYFVKQFRYPFKTHLWRYLQESLNTVKIIWSAEGVSLKRR